MGEGGFESWFSDFLDFRFPHLEWWVSTPFNKLILFRYGYLVNSALCLFCVSFAGLMSGLTLGLLSFDKMSLEILMASGTNSEKKRAKCIYSIVRHHHWLLVTLLICNACAMEALPLFLDKMVPGAVAILLSVTFILLFGEIIPQAICSRYALSIGYYATVGVWCLMIVSCPISLPIALLLDCILGKHEITLFRRAGLSELVAKHANTEKGQGPLSESEIKTIRGALGGNDKSVSHEDVMTSYKDVYMLDSQTLLNRETILEIMKVGHSRIPIFENERQNVVGLLLVKQLIQFFGVDCDVDPVIVGALNLRKMPAVHKNFSLWEMLHIFKDGNCHMALVYEKTESKFFVDASNVNLVTYIGIVTLEEVIEELIQVEIYDEFDGVVGDVDDAVTGGASTLEKHTGVAEMVRRVRLAAMKKPSLNKAPLHTPRPSQLSLEVPDVEERGEGNDDPVEIVVDGFEINKKSEEVELIADGVNDEKKPLIKKKD